MRLAAPSLLTGLGLLACLLGPSLPLAAAEEPVANYQSSLDDLVSDVAAPLGRLQDDLGRKPVRVAVCGLREWLSGQRSAFCARVEGDLAVKLKTQTLVDLPEVTPLNAALAQVGGDATDMRQMATIQALGRSLNVDAVLTGLYLLQNNQLVLTLHLVRTQDGVEVWNGSTTLTADHTLAEETTLIAGTRPLTYVPPPVPTPAPTPIKALSLDDEKAQRDQDQALRDSHFSWSRFHLETGLKTLDSLNETFSRNVGNLKGPYVRLGMADVVEVEFDYWTQSVGLPNVNYLSAFATSISLGAPLRLGPQMVLYGALGGRFEGITVNSPLFSADNTVSYGNNTFFGTVGLKLHRGPWGVDASASEDFAATYNPYMTARLGAYFEFSLE